ncbi:HepT-like ribonuclease domain-containing protein [Rhodovibrio sodomensis]|nr:HepT-like ribonuclease domain-containing protein [Rhodovibrio sodomensis]
MPTKRPRQRLADIRDNAARIEAHVACMTQAQFETDLKARDAVERCLERISEAARKLGDRYDTDYPMLDLPALRRMGSVFRHDYDNLDAGVVWTTVQSRLPAIKAMAETEVARIDAEVD